MRPETRLDSAAFQLTPTRTRCDLVVTANGRKEKIASGLLNPFVAHLKAAQEQIAKGGYTILLEPGPEAGDAPWFTMGTVERFVRFVSTPEVLERVTTVEAEMLQLEDAIAVQGNENLALRSAEGQNGKPADYGLEGSKASYDPDVDKALVLYKPDTHPATPPQNDAGAHEEHSKVQLLRVLETRKTVLRKEQAMAFARAVAAGFDIDNLLYLISFAERFGASRLMKACTQFIDLWRQKHETGQWIEVEPEAMSVRSEFPPFNAAGIMFAGDKDTMSVSNGEDAAGAGHRTPPHPHGPYQAAYPPWAMHPPYPLMQGMPYYPPPGVNPYYPPPPYPPTDDPRYNSHSERRPSRKHSADSKDFDNSGSDQSDQSGSDRESSHHGRKSSKKGKRSSKKKGNVIVIRNVNVRSKKHGSSSSESESHTGSASEDSDDGARTKSSKRNHKRSSSSKKKGGKKAVAAESEEDEHSRDEGSRGQDGEQGHWNAFQNFLLRDEEEKTRNHDNADMFAGERAPPSLAPRRKESRIMNDSVLLSERGPADLQERINELSFSPADGRMRARQMMSSDEVMMSGEGRSFADGDMKEIEAGGGGYRRVGGDDFMVYGQDSSIDRGSSLDPLAEAHYRRPAAPEEKNVQQNVGDESLFMMPVRSSSPDHHGAESRTAIDIDADFPTTGQKASSGAKASGAQLFYEPDELMPEREVEDVSFGYDPSMDYDSHMQIQPDVAAEDAEVEDASVGVEDGEKVPPGKDKKLGASDRRRKQEALARRLSSSSKGPLTDAQKRAQNLRAYKADLQKEKKEQEAEQIKRLERLKQERQKRIAARSGAADSTPTPPQAPKAKLSPKISPSAHKSSKFSDAEPGSSSPLQRKFPARSSTPGSDPQKSAKASKLGGDITSTSAVSKSTSSLPEVTKKEKSGRTAESSIERLKKLAEPKSGASAADHPPISKPASAADHPRRKSLPEDKKISAIMQLDESKSAALPELKVKSPRAPAAAPVKPAAAAVVKNKTAAAKDTKEWARGAKAAHPASEKKANGKVSRASESDDSNVVVEKSVVMLENEAVSTAPPVILPAGRIAENGGTGSDDRMENPSLESEYTTVRAPPCPVVLPGDASPAIHASENQLNSYEVDVPEYHKDELEKPAMAPMEKPYQAPFARVTSLNDATPAYHHPLPVREPDTLTLVRVQSVRARVPEPAYTVSAEEESHEEDNDKPRSKEPKGFRKLLKFGRKTHASAAMDSDAASVEEAPASGDGSMLKNLISQDDHAAGSSSSKASRTFSLLSPFRKNKVIVL